MQGLPENLWASQARLDDVNKTLPQRPESSSSTAVEELPSTISKNETPRAAQPTDMTDIQKLKQNLEQIKPSTASSIAGKVLGFLAGVINTAVALAILILPAGIPLAFALFMAFNDSTGKSMEALLMFVFGNSIKLGAYINKSLMDWSRREQENEMIAKHATSDKDTDVLKLHGELLSLRDTDKAKALKTLGEASRPLADALNFYQAIPTITNNQELNKLLEKTVAKFNKSQNEMNKATNETIFSKIKESVDYSKKLLEETSTDLKQLQAKSKAAAQEAAQKAQETLRQQQNVLVDLPAFPI